MPVGQTRRLANRRLRVNSGCKTCRARHVKCDEGRPSCANCAKRNRHCEYDRPHIHRGAVRVNPGKSSPATNNAESNSDRTTAYDHLRTEEHDHGDVVLSLSEKRVRPDALGNSRLPHRNPDALPISERSTTPPTCLVNLRTILQNGDLGKNRGFSASELIASHDVLGPSSLYASEHIPPHIPRDYAGNQPSNLHVEQDLVLSDHEILIFRNYVDRVSKWVSKDSF
ncbi:hypothetical protein Asppvi_006960 [Aspergillus pseudoviridinutans]|uniref:Zn(2)-C6 fungal-type domain-containing protein n=1 Tax=Aspergillus pseudoviridinutans TaxID=1517512 RepID=A0A9P3EU37_9EURO|nr:uncharacterized protein Asppvi_006960 [Aspergillus pseudoviridinutans]GIJ88044.1 hypothetical protein Asppvi_006960 [Aspergillus pseudoviridinutans]